MASKRFLDQGARSCSRNSKIYFIAVVHSIPSRIQAPETVCSNLAKAGTSGTCLIFTAVGNGAMWLSTCAALQLYLCWWQVLKI